MGTANQLIARARKDIGLRGRPNYLTRRYSSRNGNEFLRAAWCNMSTTEWARDTGNFEAGYCWGTDYAYTVWNAQRGQSKGRWNYGTRGIRPGDQVYFDWNARGTIGGIDHVGIVEKVLSGGRIQTIEANTGDRCARRIRSGAVITGYIRPAYDGVPATGNSGGGYGGYEPYNRTAKPGARVLRQYSQGDDVKVVQRKVGADDDGAFGPNTTAKVKAYQRSQGIEDDGIVGPITWGKILGKKPTAAKKPFPLPAGHWFGTPRADERNHSGYYWRGDRAGIRDIQGKVGVAKDGKYGPKTKAAVVRFQKRHGLKADGLVGPKTWKELFR